jgi:DNA-binding response OmpR family regulator
LMRDLTIPIIFISGRRDEALRPRLINLGAVECLLKPFSEADLLEALKASFRTN